MAIIGFEFNKINVEKKEGVKKGISIKNNVSIKDVEQVDLKLGTTKQAAAKFHFEYITVYEPNAGSISLKGSVTYLSEEEVMVIYSR